MIENLAELYRYRALLVSLIVRDLAVRYRGSVLGFLWTFLNPCLLMGVYSLVFSVYMRNPMENYTYFLFVGLLPWMWFSTSVATGTVAISERRDLINKVKFPPQILPMVVILSALTNYIFSLPLMVGLALLTGVHYTWAVVYFPVIVVVQFVFTAGVVYFTASLNVIFRDLQHLVVNILQFLFFLTPVLYSADQIPGEYREGLLRFNPLATIFAAYQDIFFHNRAPNLEALGWFAVVSLVLFFVSSHYMGDRREGFAESA